MIDLLLPSGTERVPYEVTENSATVTPKEVLHHLSCRLSVEAVPPGHHEDFVAGLGVLLAACQKVDLVDSFPSVEVGIFCHASNHPFLEAGEVVKVNVPCSLILVLCFLVSSCQEGVLDAQVHQDHDCTWEADGGDHVDYGNVACEWKERDNMCVDGGGGGHVDDGGVRDCSPDWRSSSWWRPAPHGRSFIRWARRPVISNHTGILS